MRKSQPASDTDAWLDALAGRRNIAADDEDSAGVAEGRLLRVALRRWPVAPPAPDADADRQQLAALLAAAHAHDRLAPSRGCPACQALARWLSWRRLAGATALVAAGWMTVVLMPSLTSMTPVPAPGAADALRGAGTEGVQRLRAADPRALRDRIADELAQAGIESTRYERLGRYGLDAELPSVRSAESIRLLNRHGIKVPASGGLAIEIEAGP